MAVPKHARQIRSVNLFGLAPRLRRARVQGMGQPEPLRQFPVESGLFGGIFPTTQSPPSELPTGMDEPCAS